MIERISNLAATLTARVVLAAALALTAAPPALAAPSAEAAQTLVRGVLDEVIGDLRSREELRSNEAALTEYIESRVFPHFDFERMSQRVLARHWRTASEAQRTAFIDEFKALLIRTYASAIAQYYDDEVKFVGARERKPGSRVSVRTQVLRSGQPAVPVNYELASKGDEWKVYDVSVDGVSLVINYRSGFDREVRSGGLDSLIAELRNGRVQ